MSAYASYSGEQDGSGTATTTGGSSMSQQTATEIWNHLFASAATIPFKQFTLGLTKHFNTAYKQSLYQPNGIKLSQPPTNGTAPTTQLYPCLFNAALAATGALTHVTGNEPTITRDAFILFLSRFGGGAGRYSLKDSPMDAVRNLFELNLNPSLTQSSSLLTATPIDQGNNASLVEWLHLSTDVGSNVDAFLLDSRKASLGSFIVRFSSSRPTQFAMDFLIPMDNKPKKLLIERVGEGWMKGGGKTVHPTIKALVENASSNGNWIVSKLSARFKGGNATAAANSKPDFTRDNSSHYQASGLSDAMSSVQILDSSPTFSPPLSHANSAYAATPIGGLPPVVPVQPAPVSGYAASFTIDAPPPLNHTPSGYSASFIGADSPSPTATSATSSATTAAPIVLPFNQRVLFYAVSVGDLCAVQDHFNVCEGCACVDQFGLNLVHIACANDQPEILKLLKSHVPDSFWRANVTRAISIADGAALSAYDWSNRYNPYWPSKPQTQELNICNPRALCMEFNATSSLAVLDEFGIAPSLLLERAPSMSAADGPVDAVPILLHSASGANPGASRYMAQ